MQWITSLGLAGFSGSAAFLLVIQLFRMGGISQADPLFALSSLVTRKKERNTALGLGLLLLGGILFAVGHYTVLSMFAKQDLWTLVFFGALFGFGHGWVVTLASLYLIGPRHPVKEFQELPFPMLLSYVVAHVAYGACVGTVFALYRTCVPFLPQCPGT